MSQPDLSATATRRRRDELTESPALGSVEKRSITYTPRKQKPVVTCTPSQETHPPNYSPFYFRAQTFLPESPGTVHGASENKKKTKQNARLSRTPNEYGKAAANSEANSLAFEGPPLAFVEGGHAAGLRAAARARFPSNTRSGRREGSRLAVTSGGPPSHRRGVFVGRFLFVGVHTTRSLPRVASHPATRPRASNFSNT